MPHLYPSISGIIYIIMMTRYSNLLMLKWTSNLEKAEYLTYIAWKRKMRFIEGKKERKRGGMEKGTEFWAEERLEDESWLLGFSWREDGPTRIHPFSFFLLVGWPNKRAPRFQNLLQWHCLLDLFMINLGIQNLKLNVLFSVLQGNMH